MFLSEGELPWDALMFITGEVSGCGQLVGVACQWVWNVYSQYKHTHYSCIICTINYYNYSVSIINYKSITCTCNYLWSSLIIHGPLLDHIWWPCH